MNQKEGRRNHHLIIGLGIFVVLNGVSRILQKDPMKIRELAACLLLVGLSLLAGCVVFIGCGQAADESGSSGDDTGADIPKSCRDAMNPTLTDEQKQTGDAACGEWAATICGPLAESACGASPFIVTSDPTDSLSPSGEFRCVWAETWVGAPDEGCEAGARASECVGSWYFGDGGSGGWSYRDFDEGARKIARFEGVEQPIGYKLCDLDVCACLPQ